MPAKKTAKKSTSAKKTSGKKSTSKKKSTKKNTAGNAASFLGGVVAALAILYVISLLGGKNPITYICAEKPEETVSSDVYVSESDVTTTITSIRTTYPFATTSSTAKPTESPASAKMQEAMRIRELLPSKKWKTTLMGYDATITFKKGDTADISVKIYFITEKLSANYYVYDDCSVEIRFSYGGKNYRIIGTADVVSDDKITLTTTTGETYTLNAA
ncbi:MAG: hypothetical protein E7546_02860 [Ruminococcaceae bacterium]|nr:hypothetical protein [Oscillospiraceae bacterium]